MKAVGLQPFGMAMPGSYSERQNAPVAPAGRTLDPNQRLILAMILDALQEFYKHHKPYDRSWLTNHGIYLCSYLPKRVITKRKLLWLVHRIETGEKLQFKMRR